MIYNQTNIVRLLCTLTPAELAVLCYDGYHIALYRRLFKLPDQTARLALLWEVAQADPSALLAELKALKPKEYAMYQPYLKRPPDAPANREQELALFKQMVAGTCAHKIMLLQAGSGLGKSTLLRSFLQQCQPAVPAVMIDLKGETTSLSRIFYQIGSRLGWQSLYHTFYLVQRLAQLPPPQPHVPPLLTPADFRSLLETEPQRFRDNLFQLTQALNQDLQHYPGGRVVLFFDTFEQADPQVTQWLTDSWLSCMPHQERTITLIAGQKVPEERSDWMICCTKQTLRGISIDDWLEYVQRQRWTIFKREWIEAYWHLSHGQPAQMMNFFRIALANAR